MNVPKPRVVKDPQWLQVVRQMPCWMGRSDTLYDGFGRQCDYYTTIGKYLCEASHLDTKSRDDRVLPMCGGCHRTNGISWHNGQETFCHFHDTTKDQLIREAEALYTAYHHAS